VSLRFLRAAASWKVYKEALKNITKRRQNVKRKEKRFPLSRIYTKIKNNQFERIVVPFTDGVNHLRGY
jgi:preprotein translocase subunit SecA